MKCLILLHLVDFVVIVKLFQSFSGYNGVYCYEKCGLSVSFIDDSQSTKHYSSHHVCVVPHTIFSEINPLLMCRLVSIE